jgi:ribosome assembly protein YihI (activator of Der GTPase)
MKLLPFVRRANSRRSGLALAPEQADQMVHDLEERLQAIDQCLAEQLRALDEGLRLNRPLQAFGDAKLSEKIEGVSEEVEALGAERVLLETQV